MEIHLLKRDKQRCDYIYNSCFPCSLFYLKLKRLHSLLSQNVTLFSHSPELLDFPGLNLDWFIYSIYYSDSYSISVGLSCAIHFNCIYCIFYLIFVGNHTNSSTLASFLKRLLYIFIIYDPIKKVYLFFRSDSHASAPSPPPRSRPIHAASRFATK